MRLSKLLIIPLLFLFIYLILISYPYFLSKINRYDSLGPLSLVEEKSINLKKTFSPQRKTDSLDIHLLKGEKIEGKFRASENNLGIVLVRFVQLSGKVLDKVNFRIKKQEEPNWYYENTYKANQFQSNQYFTFGFPPITNSRNNIYDFEIESLSGTYKNGIGLSQVKPQFATVYKYSIKDLENYKVLIPFIFKKFIYISNNVNFLQNWQILATFILFFLLVLLMREKKFSFSKNYLLVRKNPGKTVEMISNKFKLGYSSFYKGALASFNSLNHLIRSNLVYYKFLNTNMKKRLVIALLIFSIALSYRLISSSVNLDKLFYAGLGGQGDYDQFVRASTCAVTSFCSAILGQNFLFEASILGMFFKFFGFAGALKAYVYLMILFSSVVATLPYIMLSRKNWLTIGGILGGLFLATNNFLTTISLNFPPDNSSLFTFSLFAAVYYLTIQRGTIRWFIFLGLMGLIDGLNKALFLINDLAALALFIPTFIYEKLISKGKIIFRKGNRKVLVLSLLPLLIFLLTYSFWEYIVYVKFSASYFLRGLLTSTGGSYVIYTSFSDKSFSGTILSSLFYLFTSAVIMIRHLVDYADLQTLILFPIFLGMVIVSFLKKDSLFKRTGLIFAFSLIIFYLLTLIKNDFYKVHEVFNGDYIYTWTDSIYFNVFLFIEILFLFLINLKYTAIKLSLPIITYFVMLIFMAKNAPFARLHTHVIAWSVFLFAYLVDWIMNNFRITGSKILIGLIFVVLFVYLYAFPKTVFLVQQLNLGITSIGTEVKYLRWVNENIPENSVVLAGGKSDFVMVAENINKPIVFNTLWASALLINPKEIPGISPQDFSLIAELSNRDNFKRKKYIILEDDVYIWRDRVTGVVDNVFAPFPKNLHAEDYSIKTYKYNQDFNKAIYELDLAEH